MSKKRLKTPNSCYHIFNRGIDGKIVFHDDEDRFVFHKILVRLIVEKELKFTCHGYAEMDNHFHLLIETFDEDISKILYFLGFLYAQYYNKKYNRKGYLFQDSFESRLIFDNNHFKVVQAYIHNNWNEVGKTNRTNNMLYCSYQCFIKQRRLFEHLDISKSLKFYGVKLDDAIPEFIRYTNQTQTVKFLTRYRFSDLLFLILKMTKKIIERRWLVIAYLLKIFAQASHKEIYEILQTESLLEGESLSTYRRKYLRGLESYPRENLDKALERLRRLSQLSPGLG